MNIMLECILKFKRKILVYFTGIMIYSISAVLEPLIFSHLIDKLVAKVDYDKIIKLIIIVILMNLCNIIITYILGIYEKKIFHIINCICIQRIIEHYHKVPYIKVMKFDSIYISQRIKDDTSKIILFLIKETIRLLFSICKLLIALYFLVKISKTFILILLIALPIYISLYEFIKNPLYRRNYEVKEESDLFVQNFTYQLSNTKDIRIKASYDKSSIAFKKKCNDMYNSAVNYAKVSYLFHSLDNVITTFFHIVVIMIFIKDIYHGRITIGQFIIVQTYFGMIVNSIKIFMSYSKKYLEIKASINRINDITKLKLEVNGSSTVDEINSINIKNIKFSYKSLNPEDKISTMTNYSFIFKKNNIYVIKGCNGSGKSTLLDIIIGLYQDDLESGSIQYNEVDLRKLDMYTVRKEMIGYVHQINYYGNETVSEFLFYNEHTLDKYELNMVKEEIYNKCNNLGLTKYFFNNVFDINSILSKKMSSLSGGKDKK